MGKRERRRKRQRAKQQAAAPQLPVTVLYPEADPLLRVEISPEASAAVRELCASYWQISADGSWNSRVGDLAGDTRWVSATVSGASRAVLLASRCRACAEPLVARSRAQAVSLGGGDLRQVLPYVCEDCKVEQQDVLRAQQEAAAAQAAAREQREKERAEHRQRTVEDFLSREAARELQDDAFHGAQLEPPGVAVLAAMAAFVRAVPNKPVPPLNALGEAGWVGDFDVEVEALRDLRRAGVLAVDTTSPRTAITVSAEDDISFLLDEVSWRLVGGVSGAAGVIRAVKQRLIGGMGDAVQRHREGLTELVLGMEVKVVLSYLDGLLTTRYDYPQVPEARLTEVTETIRDGLGGKYTYGQMITLAWRAVDSAASWKERAQVGPPEASSASVTMLRKKLQDARERRSPVPEYEPHRWQALPPALVPARRLVDAIMWPRLRENINACEGCDQNGWVETEDDRVLRCLHPSILADAPRL